MQKVRRGLNIARIRVQTQYSAYMVKLHSASDMASARASASSGGSAIASAYLSDDTSIVLVLVPLLVQVLVVVQVLPKYCTPQPLLLPTAGFHDVGHQTHLATPVDTLFYHLLHLLSSPENLFQIGNSTISSLL